MSTKPPSALARCFLVWSEDAYLYYSLAAWHVFNFVACCFVWFNNTVCSGEFYGLLDQKLLKAGKTHTTLERMYFQRNDSCSFRFSKFCGSVATETDAVNYVSPRSSLAISHFLLGFFLGHLWYVERARATAVGLEKGIDGDLEPSLSFTPLN
ncbi:hypothetical protein RJ640_023505 [Escallonia rubra]|uniref:Uncharacterized protein n=1 Tax=Escallonia rubra TaxID=112253 RepID=A0AA88QZ84_9ASTE|nr:hypothetical protein RJ640_023505 [Escallonia rubra]